MLRRIAILSGLIAIGVTVSAFAAAPAMAKDWPAKPLTLVVPFAAGGSTDVLGRIMAARMSEILGEPIVVENVGGAGGTIGAHRVANAAPDGYQVVLGNTGNFAQSQSLFKKPSYNSLTDFAPVVLLAEQPIVLIARKDLPANDLREFIAYSKEHRANMRFGSAGVGSTIHLACALLNTSIGIDVVHVPYRGGGQAMTDLIAGRLDYQCPIVSAAISPIGSRQVKAIAILSRRRSTVLPDLATADEQGLKNFEAHAWNALFLPKGTPPAIVKKLHDAAVAALDTPSVQERLKKIGIEVVEPERRSSAYLQDFLASEIKKWAAPIKATGLTLD
jgi:tripartite-type tricarboxylate transporter receptor subunit TctC